MVWISRCTQKRSKAVQNQAVAYLGGGGIVPWPPPLWLVGKFFEGLEDRWKGGWPPPRLDGSGAQKWRE
jgi:hypothetical protein